jgi:hypothetical protein
MLEWSLSFVDEVTFYKNIFHVMFCAEHCVYMMLGTPNLWLVGRGTVGLT